MNHVVHKNSVFVSIAIRKCSMMSCPSTLYCCCQIIALSAFVVTLPLLFVVIVVHHTNKDSISKSMNQKTLPSKQPKPSITSKRKKTNTMPGKMDCCLLLTERMEESISNATAFEKV